jgi:predicted transcriptional regulator of viral defense system
MSNKDGIYERLLQIGAFRVDDLPADLRKLKFLPQRLSALARRGALRRVRRGAYVVVPTGETASKSVVDPYVVASVVARPYAVSLYSALEIRGLAESVSHRIYIQSPKRARDLTYAGIEYRCVFGPVDFGVETVVRGTVEVNVTDLEHTVLDCLRHPDYAGGTDEFLRALDGVQKQDLLLVVLERCLAPEAPAADWLKLRADLEDRRPELNDLVDAALLLHHEGRVYLSIKGLLLCPGPRAAEVRRAAGALFAELRGRYKQAPEKLHKLRELAAAIGVQESEARVILSAFIGTTLITIIQNTDTGWPSSVRGQEAVLDYRDFEHYAGKVLEKTTIPKEYSGAPRGIAYLRTDRVLEYLNRFREGALFCKAGYLLTLFRREWSVPEEALLRIRRRLPSRKYYFPPRLGKGAGRLVRDWNLIVPAHLYSRYVMATGRREEAPSGIV